MNAEQEEAKVLQIQQELDRQKKEIRKKLSKLENSKLDKVEECADILTENDIPFVLFANISDDLKTGFWQYNRMYKKEHENCFYCDESRENVDILMHEFVKSADAYLNTISRGKFRVKVVEEED